MNLFFPAVHLLQWLQTEISLGGITSFIGSLSFHSKSKEMELFCCFGILMLFYQNIFFGSCFFLKMNKVDRVNDFSQDVLSSNVGTLKELSKYVESDPEEFWRCWKLPKLEFLKHVWKINRTMTIPSIDFYKEL